MNSLEELDDVRRLRPFLAHGRLVRMTAMQSYWMQMTNTETVLDLRDTPVPTPGPGQLLVRMRAAALEPRRVRARPWPARQGRYLEGHRRGGRRRGRCRRRASHRLQAGRPCDGPVHRSVFGIRADGSGEAIAAPPACRGKKPRAFR